MKTILIIVAAITSAFNLFGQGTVIFTLKSGTVLDAPVYGPEPTRLTESKQGNTSSGIPAGTQVYNGPLLNGSGYLAQLRSFRVDDPYGDWEPALTLAAPFGSGTEAGYIAQTIATLSNVPKDYAGAAVTVFAWDNSSGLYPTWDLAAKAWNKGRIAAGQSAVFKVNAIGGDVNPPPLLVGLESFNIFYIPEPSAMALAGLSAGILLAMSAWKLVTSWP